MDGNGRWAKKRHLPRLQGHRVGQRIGADGGEDRGEDRNSLPHPLHLFPGKLAAVQGGSRGADAAPRRGPPARNTRSSTRTASSSARSDVSTCSPANTRRALDETMEKLAQERAAGAHARRELRRQGGDRGRVRSGSPSRCKRGEIDAAGIDEEVFRRALYQPDVPDPDLLIRTSGEIESVEFPALADRVRGDPRHRRPVAGFSRGRAHRQHRRVSEARAALRALGGRSMDPTPTTTVRRAFLHSSIFLRVAASVVFIPCFVIITNAGGLPFSPSHRLGDIRRDVGVLPHDGGEGYPARTSSSGSSARWFSRGTCF